MIDDNNTVPKYSFLLKKIAVARNQFVAIQLKAFKTIVL